MALDKCLNDWLQQPRKNLLVNDQFLELKSQETFLNAAENGDADIIADYIDKGGNIDVVNTTFVQRKEEDLLNIFQQNCESIERSIN
jgi:hypothetical protein